MSRHIRRVDPTSSTHFSLIIAGIVDFQWFAPLNTQSHSLHIRVRAFAVFGDEAVDLSAKEEVRRKN
jgi:hypothetical protein